MTSPDRDVCLPDISCIVQISRWWTRMVRVWPADSVKILRDHKINNDEEMATNCKCMRRLLLCTKSGLWLMHSCRQRGEWRCSCGLSRRFRCVRFAIVRFTYQWNEYMLSLGISLYLIWSTSIEFVSDSPFKTYRFHLLRRWMRYRMEDNWRDTHRLRSFRWLREGL